MRELNFSDFRNSDLFQQFCEQLLCIEYPDFRPMNDTRGDKGCDGLARNDELFFQVYYPEAHRYEERMNNIRRKISTDLKKLHTPYPKEWILVTVEKVSFQIQEYCRKKEKEYGSMRILIWSEPKLKSLLDRHQELKKRWIKRIYGDNIEVIQPEAVTYSQRNNISDLLELDKRLGASLSGWEHSDILKQVHTYDSTGKAKVAIVLKDNTTELKVHLNVLLRFDSTVEGEKKYNEFIESQKYGKEFELDERFIEKASLQINNRKVQEFITPVGGKALMKIKPVPGPPLDAYIDFFGRNKIRLQRISNLKLKVTRISEDIFQLDNYSQETEKVKLKLNLNIITGQNEFSISVDDKSSDSVDGLRYATSLLNSVRSSMIKLYLINSIKPLEFINNNTPSIEVKNTYDYSKMLQDIQDAIGEKIPSLFSTTIDNKDIDIIKTIHQIIKKGKVVYGKSTFTTTLSNLPIEPFRKLLNNNGISLKLISEPIEAFLLGKNIQLGHKITYFDGVLDDESRENLNAGINRGNVEGIKIVVKSREIDQPTVDLYPYWMKDSEKKVKAFEEKRAKDAINAFKL